MSKLNHLYNAEKILSFIKWGDNVMKACLSIQWSLHKVVIFPSQELSII